MLTALVVMCLAAGDGGVDAVDAAEFPDAGEVALEDAGAPLADAPLAADAGTLITPAVATDVESQSGKPEFVKGELSVYLGSDRLTVKNTRIGVSVGLDRFLQSYFVLIEPLVDLRFLDGSLGIGVGVPLRLELVNFETNPMSGAPYLFSRAGRLRVEDWDTFHDFGRILKYVTYGRKEDNLYISAGQRYASSIGHGAITRRYSPNIDVDYPRASAQVDAYNDYGGFELMTNDLLAWNQLAGLAFIKPLSFFKPQNLIAHTLSVGVSGGLDWQVVSMGGERQLRDGRLVANPRAAGLIGFDVEAKVVKTDNVDIKPYVDYSFLVGGDGGLTAGVLGRFNVGTKVVNAFRVVAEARFLGDRYIPSYFDTFYEVDRFIYRDVRLDPAVANFVPKHRYALEHGLGTRAGYYFEASWGIRGAGARRRAQLAGEELRGAPRGAGAEFSAGLRQLLPARRGDVRRAGSPRQAGQSGPLRQQGHRVRGRAATVASVPLHQRAPLQDVPREPGAAALRQPVRLRARSRGRLRVPQGRPAAAAA